MPSPTVIKLRFEVTPAVTVRPETFKVRYGSLQLDVTSRASVEEAVLPKGSHRLLIQIEGSLGRAGECEVTFVVEQT